MKQKFTWRNWPNEQMSRKHKNVCATLNYIEISYLSFYNYWMYFNFCFGSLLGIPIGIISSEIGLKICTIAKGIKKYKWIFKKKNHDKIVLLTKSKLNSIKS